MPTARAARLASNARFITSHPRAFFLIDRIRKSGLTFLDRRALYDIVEVIDSIERHGIEGAIVEAGCARGGAAIAMASVKSPKRAMAVYDVFGMIPPPTEKDGPDVHERYAAIIAGAAEGVDGTSYYGYEADLYTQVCRSFAKHGINLADNNIRLIQGLFDDTLHPDGSISCAHIDCDWYESVTTCLNRIVPRLSRGGVLVIDDYYSWSGCKQAVDDYFSQAPGELGGPAGPAGEYRFVHKSRLHIQRL